VGDSVATNVLNFIRACRINADIVGRIEAGKNVFMEVDGELEMLKLSYREAPYTPVKRVAAVVDLPDSFDAMQAALRTAVLKSLAKKARIVEWVKSRSAP
jgi:hydrogenase maturation factor HypE